MIPEGPVKESDESNVTLFCNILDANPSSLTKVRWYANSTLLKELPDCEETRVYCTVALYNMYFFYVYLLSLTKKGGFVSY